MSVDLRTRYLGLDLTGPIVASAGPLTGRLETLQRLAAAGAAAVVLPSLFEEDIVAAAFEQQALYDQGAGVFGEAFDYLPDLPGTASSIDRHVQLVADASARLDVPVIASLNGTSPGGWLSAATALADAGAAAIELNLYVVAADPADTAATVEDRLIDLVLAVRSAVAVPIAVKLSPFFSALGNVAEAIAGAGADGLVLFNRFYQPDIDLDSLAVVPSLDLSTSADLRLPLRWIAILRDRIPCSLALSGGVHTAEDALKGLLAGADVVMSTAALLQHGPEHVRTLLDGVTAWLDHNEYESVAQLRGSMSQRSVPDPDAYERANYVRVLRSVHTDPAGKVYASRLSGRISTE
ncbi:MAG: dihydroorotate dehydrogenase-like protein [Acidimicrobiia bacterium]